MAEVRVYDCPGGGGFRSLYPDLRDCPGADDPRLLDLGGFGGKASRFLGARGYLIPESEYLAQFATIPKPASLDRGKLYGLLLAFLVLMLLFVVGKRRK